MHLGKSLGNTVIIEGRDVYFDCDIASNPRPRRISWHKDVS